MPAEPTSYSRSSRENLPFIWSPKGECTEHCEDSHHQNPGVNPDVSGLQTRSKPAEPAGESGTAVYEQTVDQAIVDEAPEELPREHIGRRDDGSIQCLVDVVLVGHHPFEAVLRHSVALPPQAIRLETREYDDNT